MDLVEDGVFRIQVLLLLIVVARLDVDAEADPAAVRLDLSEQDLEQSRLSYAVGADYAYPVPLFYLYYLFRF